MKKSYGYEAGGNSMNLSDSVECMALLIAEDCCGGEKSENIKN